MAVFFEVIFKGQWCLSTQSHTEDVGMGEGQWIALMCVFRWIHNWWSRLEADLCRPGRKGNIRGQHG